MGFEVRKGLAFKSPGWITSQEWQLSHWQFYLKE